jgi:hypothetical protein
MDANFLYWLRLTLKSTENIAHIRSDVHALFEKILRRRALLHLRNKLQSIAYRCPEIRMIVPPRTAFLSLFAVLFPNAISFVVTHFLAQITLWIRARTLVQPF